MRGAGLKRISTLLPLLMLIGAWACSAPESTEEIANRKIGDLAVDPTSVELSSLKSDDLDIICGRVNLRNTSGNYVGWAEFVIDVKADVVAIDAPPDSLIADAVQSSEVYPEFLNLFIEHCETVEQRDARLMSESEENARVLREAEEAAEATRLAAAGHEHLERERGRRGWFSGKWMEIGNTEYCAFSYSPLFRPDGTFVAQDYWGRWEITENTVTRTPLGHSSSNPDLARAVMTPTVEHYRRVSENVMESDIGGAMRRYERCP